MNNYLMSGEGLPMKHLSKDGKKQNSESTFPGSGWLLGRAAVFLTKLMWLIFITSSILLILFFIKRPEWKINGFFILDGLTVVMWVAASFFSGIVHSYALRYMAGYKKLNNFIACCFGFTLAVMFVTAADHVAIFILFWLIMGILMAKLIGHIPGWGEAKASGRNALNYFIGSAFFLAAGVLLLAYQTNELSISNITSDFSLVSKETGILAAGFLLVAAMIQSAIFPFHSWLMSSMTAPTPASALMHAGFVNAAGILLTRFSPVFYKAEFLWVIVLIGGIGALMGEFWKFVQTNIKRKLACSTVAQMGFMILQCGLGFFTAAITHLILHGFYKAYLFLSSGSAIEHTAPGKKIGGNIKFWQLTIMLISGIMGGVLFSFLTGKGLELNSSMLLTFVVVLTIVHGTQDILKRTTFSGLLRILAIPCILFPAIGIYALVFNNISGIMKDLPMVQTPTELSAVHVLIAIVYLVSFLAIEAGWYKKSKRLYVALLNVSQPKINTVLMFKK